LAQHRFWAPVDGSSRRVSRMNERSSLMMASFVLSCVFVITALLSHGSARRSPIRVKVERLKRPCGRFDN
jgi:hypothetical protein